MRWRIHRVGAPTELVAEVVFTPGDAGGPGALEVVEHVEGVRTLVLHCLADPRGERPWLSAGEPAAAPPREAAEVDRSLRTFNRRFPAFHASMHSLR